MFKTVFLLLSFGFILFSCSSQALDIKNQTYKSYNRNSEKGYIVSFELNDTTIVPKSVVINGIVQNISSTNKMGNTYQINVIAQTTLIHALPSEIRGKRKRNLFRERFETIFSSRKIQINHRLISSFPKNHSQEKKR